MDASDQAAMQPSQTAPLSQQNASSGQGASVAEPVATPQAPSAPVGVAGGSNKEAAPISIDISKPSESLIRPSEAEPQLHPEVKEAGVEVSPNHEVPSLTYDDKQAGLTHAKEVTPVATEPSGLVNMPFPTPMTLQQAETVIKTDRNTADSKLWLGTLIRKLFRQFDISQKKAA